MNPLEELQLSMPLPDTLEAELRVAYASPPRAYHNFDHLLEVLAHFARVPDWDDRDSAALAILFHDAIYVAGRADNEAASAEFARAQLRGTRWAGKIERVCDLVLLTARHGSLRGDGLDRDARQFLDCDMAILGAEPGAYDAYERAIAEEYASMPPELYRAGRARFLEQLLQSPRIFLSDFFFAEREGKARENLRRALAAVGG
jgi:predicted metal-dependent HD superfamily phosphohydrolase